ncbi:hypothetical protein BAUCODRAFT_205265 [Baudoinia panamericana UAMH 10762]|uniref:Guanine nucleotide-binding protein-like 3 N-terminal domain-containing protein n=1 Tax=Baudoinia panamericana (strain UAMH 10762) TaxID=717646 RepID=M2NQI2_BAUPA|nr:uncharacterized protein BAUCODRAFT_205265 [Baudoinia panamericana UAMH 10762]EMD01311.1 hypothetical protein BAUCODRAFT_205265 [Baudoinia panamericana UAMH 10762]
MKVGKPQSKRVPVRLRHKIQKASAAKQRKQRKEAKKNPQWVSRLKKDPGIPNLFPFKAQVLAEIEESRRKKVEDAQKKREVAKAQRMGTAATAQVAKTVTEDDDDEILLDEEDDDRTNEVDEMEVRNEGNPMAALLASAQARAQAYSKADEVADNGAADGGADDNDDDGEWDGIDDAAISASGQATKKVLPKQALEDPIKAVNALMERIQRTQDGIQRLIDHYQIPPLVTAGSDTTTRFLVEVARKRGRLSRGGVPNMHAAALTVLSDLNEERLVLPINTVQKPPAVSNKSEVQIVSQMAEPLRIEGLFAGGDKRGQGAAPPDMEVEL